MRKLILCGGMAAVLLSCNNESETKETKNDSTTSGTTDLPYTANYTSQWNDNVSDADLKTVLTTYKDWENNNLEGLSKAMGDSVVVEMSNGDHLNQTNAELMKMWSTYRDSLSSVTIRMDAWHKMYSTDKKDAYIVTWYDEIDTYKSGRVDSASYHDINQLKDGKIIWYSQYKRPKKPAAKTQP